MRRFFIEERLPENPGGEFAITGGDARHISRSLRMAAGDEIIVVAAGDGGGKTALAVIVNAALNRIDLKLKEIIDLKTEPLFKIWLAQGIPKGDKMDFIIQKAVELGAYGVIPVVCERSVVRYDALKEAARLKRWRKIAEEAAKQCGRTHIPHIAPITPLPALFAENSSVLEDMQNVAIFMLYEGEAALGLKAALSKRPLEASSYLFVVGPEGGFSAEEAELVKSRGADIVTMGVRIMRTETASLAALSAVMYELGELG